MKGVLAAVCLSVTLQLCVSITAVATMLQGATAIYWTVVVLQERTVEEEKTAMKTRGNGKFK